MTLGLTALAERKALIKQDRAWLILDLPPAPHSASLDVPPLGPADPLDSR